MARRTGLLGGTFNPIHNAHLAIAEDARAACRLDRVLFLPAADPPHKPVAGDVSFDHRLAMVELAIAGYPHFSASSVETEIDGKNYSVDTLRTLHRRYPDDTFYFIIGLDSFRDLPGWKGYHELFRLTHLVVAARPGICSDLMLLLPVAIRREFCYSAESKNLLHESGNRVIFIEESELDISSTKIRKRLADRQEIRDLVPDGVADYIERHGLYRGNSHCSQKNGS